MKNIYSHSIYYDLFVSQEYILVYSDCSSYDFLRCVMITLSAALISRRN